MEQTMDRPWLSDGIRAKQDDVIVPRYSYTILTNHAVGLQVYRITGELGRATSNYLSTGDTLERAKYGE